MNRKQLDGLQPATYEHPLDRTTLDALQHTAGFATLVRKFNEWGGERLLRIQLTGSNIRITADSFPEIYKAALEARKCLDLPIEPELYIVGSGEINAFTTGVESPIVALTSGAIDFLSDDELLFVVAHEFGHIKSGHALYYDVASYLPFVADAVGSAGFGVGQLTSLVTTALQISLLNWKRTSEFTADRAGLLALQDVTAAIGALMKLAGLPAKYAQRVNVDDFIAQARSFEAMDTDKLSKVAKWLSVMDQSHPWTVLRAKELLDWAEAGGYERVMNSPRVPKSAGEQKASRFCTGCGYRLKGPETFCPGCGIRCPGTAA